MAQQDIGPGESETGTGGASATVVIVPYRKTGKADAKLVLRVAAEGAFALDIQTSDDGGSTFYGVGAQVASAARTASGTGSYDNQASLIDVSMPASGRVVFIDTSSASNPYVWDWRIYHGGK